MFQSAPVLAIAALLFTAVSAAEPSTPVPADNLDQVTGELMDEFMAWISTSSGLALCRRPTLRYAEHGEIVRRWYGREMPEGQIIKVLALYEYPTSTVYLATSFDPDALLDKSILLHELVHHMQEYNEIEFECRAASEPQAYELQAKWLKEQGIDDPWGLMGLDQFTVYALSICPE